MNLRLTLLTLCLLTFLSASTGGYLYYSTLKDATFLEAERQAVLQAAMIQKNLTAILSENIKPVRTMAEIPAIQDAIIQPLETNIYLANHTLDLFKITLNADVCYILNKDGITVSSSNRNSSDSFVGQNFSFRPYFKQALQGKAATYLALGTTSKKRGVYCSYPIYHASQGQAPIGVAVIKASIELIESEILSHDETILVTDPHGMIFIANQARLLFKLFKKLTPEELASLAKTRQFGNEPWKWSGFSVSGNSQVTNNSGQKYLIHTTMLENYPGWQVIQLRERDKITNILSTKLIRITGVAVIAFCLAIGFTVTFLYRRATREIAERKQAQTDLRVSEKRYRSIYNKTPAMLHSIDKEGRLLSVSDHWLKVMGYDLNEVIGQKLTKFYTESSRRYAEEVIIPQFFITGHFSDVAYQFVKKNGEIIDVILSAISEKNQEGEIVKSLAVSVDVTERKKAEEALKQAKEELSQYSRNLEKQVEKRTREINSILTNTPDVVYLKDNQGRFTLINKKFEEILAKAGNTIHLKTDFDIFEQFYAEQFVKNDKIVLDSGKSLQVEEKFPQHDGIHTYLSVKFPIYDNDGTINGVCSISTDVTALNKAQEQLRRLSAAIMNSQESERALLARELHDELGQVLTALKIESVGLLERLRQCEHADTNRATKMCDLIDNTIDEVRGMAFRLRPGVLDDLGLVDALEWYTADYEKRIRISCFFEHRNIPIINDPIATAAYRITQEALTNVARHSGANKVIVSLQVEGQLFTLKIADKGKGFDPEHLSETEGLGVAGMQERALLAGGVLKVKSIPGKGTDIIFSVKLTS